MNEEQKAKARELRYKVALLGNTCGPLLGTALLAGGVNEWLALAVAAIGILTGSAGNAVAAGKTKRQIEDGTFAPKPDLDLSEVVSRGLKEMVDTAAVAVGRLNAVTEVAAAVLPGVVAAVDPSTAVDRAIAAAREA